MIAFVHGMAVDMTESSVVVEAGGIGYEIYMTGADLSEIRMGGGCEGPYLFQCERGCHEAIWVQD